MVRNPYFEESITISQEEFLKAWQDSEANTKHDPDQNSYDRLERHKHFTGLKYYKVWLTEEGLMEIILPHHAHVGNEVGLGGDSFRKIVEEYCTRLQADQKDACLDRIHQIREELTDLFTQSDTFLGTDYTIGHIYNDPTIAMLSYSDHGANKLYVGNFHRFVAYGVWIVENSYHPIKVYYCENPSLCPNR